MAWARRIAAVALAAAAALAILGPLPAKAGILKLQFANAAGRYSDQTLLIDRRSDGHLVLSGTRQSRPGEITQLAVYSIDQLEYIREDLVATFLEGVVDFAQIVSLAGGTRALAALANNSGALRKLAALVSAHVANVLAIGGQAYSVYLTLDQIRALNMILITSDRTVRSLSDPDRGAGSFLEALNDAVQHRTPPPSLRRGILKRVGTYVLHSLINGYDALSWGCNPGLSCM
jgi:hypothetical protein